MAQPFVRLEIGPGLYGVTKLRWRNWTSRNWLSWLIAAVFLVVAITVIVLTSKTSAADPTWHRATRWVVTVGLVALVVVRLILEGTIFKPPPGQPPPWDRQLADPWWTTIHTLTGVVLGFWLTPFVVTVAATLAWEVLEISVPGFGDEEVNGNRLVDNLVAWAGWLVVVVLSAVVSGLPIPFI